MEEIHLANTPTPFAITALDSDRHRAPLARPAPIAAEQDRIPLRRFQNSLKNRRGIAELLVEPEFEILALKSRHHRMAGIARNEMARAHDGGANFERGVAEGVLACR